MGTQTPSMNQGEIEDYLKRHLANELHWLLRAATEWHVQGILALCIDGCHVQVYAMDSCFLHARTLFEFFTKRATGNHYGYDTFSVPALASPLYTNDWVGPLHSYILHAQSRSTPRQLQGIDGSMKHLNEMPVDFATEIVRLWRAFTLLLRANPRMAVLESVAEATLDEAIAAAKRVASSALVHLHVVTLKKPILEITW